MHIALPFYMDTITNSFGQPERMWGRAVANHGFVRALAELAPSVRLTLLVPTARDAATLQRTLLAGLPRPIDLVPFRQMQDFLGNHPPDVLHVLDPNLWIGAHIRARLSSRPFVVTGITHSLGNQHFLNWAVQNSANGVGPGDCLVCTTPTARQVVESVHRRLADLQPGFGAPRTAVIPLGVSAPEPADPAGSPTPPNTTLSRATLGLTDGDFVILSFARFHPQFKMDLLPLLNLLTLLNQSGGRPARLVLAGAADNGAYARFVEQRVRDSGLEGAVRFALDASDADKAALHDLADVFLSLSDNLQETFGLTVVEAMAAGLPVVASDWDGYRALVRDGVDGYLVPTRWLPADPDFDSVLAIQNDPLTHLFCAQATAVDLPVAADRLTRLAGDPEAARRMGAAARATAEGFAWKNLIPRYLDLWQQLVAAAQGQVPPRPDSRDRSRSSALRYLEDFAGYATGQLRPEDRFVTSALGRQLLAGSGRLDFYADMDEFLEPRLMDLLLRGFAVESDWRAVLGQVTNVPGVAPLAAAQSLLWLYKYGYLEARPGPA